MNNPNFIFNKTKDFKDFITNIFFSTLLVSSIYLFDLDIFIFELRHLIILLIIPIIYQKKLDRSDLIIVAFGVTIYFHSTFMIEGKLVINYRNIIISIYLIFLIKIIKEFNKNFLNLINFHINYFFIIFFIAAFGISFYYFYFAGVISSHCIIGCFSIYRVFFLENSHLGMIAGSLIIYQVYLFANNSKNFNYYIFSIFLIIVFLNYSLTNYLGIIFSSLFILIMFWKKLNKKFIFSLIVMISVCLFSIMSNRVNLIKVQSIVDPFAQVLLKQTGQFKKKYFTKAIEEIVNEEIIFNEIGSSKASGSDYYEYLKKKIIILENKKSTTLREAENSYLDIKIDRYNEIVSKNDTIDGVGKVSRVDKNLFENLIVDFSKIILKKQLINIKQETQLGKIKKVTQLDKIKSNNFKKNKKKVIEERIKPTNMSSDVWLKSLKISFISLKNYPLGVGLNNYFFSHTKYKDDIEVDYEMSKTVNKEDASFNFAKLVAEFGLFSLLIAYIILKFSFSNNIPLEYKIFLLPNVFTQMLFRGAGYFNGGFIIFILIMFFLIITKTNVKNNTL